MMLVMKALFIQVLFTSIVESELRRSGLGLGPCKDPCDNYYCAHGGTCVSNSYNGYKRCRQSTPRCQCAGSWTGERCDDNPCDGINCNAGTCYSDDAGSPACICPEGCTGDTCSDDDNTSCEAANGMCVADDGTCTGDRLLDIPCCNGKVCCGGSSQDHPCDSVNCGQSGFICVAAIDGEIFCIPPWEYS